MKFVRLLDAYLRQLSDWQFAAFLFPLLMLGSLAVGAQVLESVVQSGFIVACALAGRTLHRRLQPQGQAPSAD